MTFLNGVITDLLEAKHARPEQPLLFLRMHVAQFQLALGQLKECKDAVEEGKQTLDTLDDVSMHAYLQPVWAYCEGSKGPHAAAPTYAKQVPSPGRTDAI